VIGTRDARPRAPQRRDEVVGGGAAGDPAGDALRGAPIDEQRAQQAPSVDRAPVPAPMCSSFPAPGIVLLLNQASIMMFLVPVRTPLVGLCAMTVEKRDGVALRRSQSSFAASRGGEVRLVNNPFAQSEIPPDPRS